MINHIISSKSKICCFDYNFGVVTSHVEELLYPSAYFFDSYIETDVKEIEIADTHVGDEVQEGED
jgi:hypothetical protein